LGSGPVVLHTKDYVNVLQSLVDVIDLIYEVLYAIPVILSVLT
jgi:hypothetical protein